MTRSKSFVAGTLVAGLAGVVIGACGGTPSGGADFGDAGAGAPGSGSGSPGSFGNGDGGAGPEPCTQAGQTRACWTGDPSQRNVGACHDGTQQCVAHTSSEFTTLTWGPCTGEQTHCGSGTGGGGAEDGGGAGNGGGGNEDGGGGNGGGGNEDGGGGNGGGGNEDGGGGNGGGGGEPIDAGPQPSCSSSLNSEPEILAAYEPANGGSVSIGGQIKVWVNDECAPTVAPGEQVDPTTGNITVAGNVTALASDGYPYEPVLYIGGAAHIPSRIKGSFNASPPSCAGSFGFGTASSGPPIDPCPAQLQPSFFLTAEFIWDVSALGLSPGTYNAEFVIHDGDSDRAIGCVSIVIK